MEQANCGSLKAELLEYIARQIDVTAVRDKCVITLPTKTLDDRYPDVFIERKMPDYFLVHDAGKTTSELFAQGIHITDARADLLSSAAERLGVNFVDGVFNVGCTGAGLSGAILAVSQCMSLGMWEVVHHKPDFGDAPILTLAENALLGWNPGYEHRIQKNLKVKGRQSNHVFEFVSFPTEAVHLPIGLRILRPSENPYGQAERYGFFAYDITQTIFENWLRLAVVVKADKWSEESKRIIRKFSNGTLEVETGDEHQIQQLVPHYMDQIAA